ncbi:MAG: type II toxin-antitoxin system ParD family antitoxin [Actinomycetota bacterium]|nr:type II toxin-antitoxin system ParD family antitoxin [Acidimicrobiia bacterium]MDQ3470472.1 type II toxin-antitoxin system ParD family antitoxin [Actinomycetota bacterium]
MSMMNLSLPDEMRAFVDERVEGGRYGSIGEYVRDLIRRDQDRQQLRDLILDGAGSALRPVADATFVSERRSRLGTSN